MICFHSLILLQIQSWKQQRHIKSILKSKRKQSSGINSEIIHRGVFLKMAGQIMKRKHRIRQSKDSKQRGWVGKEELPDKAYELSVGKNGVGWLTTKGIPSPVPKIHTTNDIHFDTLDHDIGGDVSTSKQLVTCPFKLLRCTPQEMFFFFFNTVSECVHRERSRTGKGTQQSSPSSFHTTQVKSRNGNLP